VYQQDLFLPFLWRVENWSVLWIRKTKDLLRCDTCFWLVCSGYWNCTEQLFVSDDTQQTPWKAHCLLPWTDAEGWAGKRGGEGGASRCSCLDRMKSESCVRVWPMSPRARHSPLPFWGELFFPHFSVTLCVRGHPLVLEVKRAAPKDVCCCRQ